jgi:hypothetical protein
MSSAEAFASVAIFALAAAIVFHALAILKVIDKPAGKIASLVKPSKPPQQQKRSAILQYEHHLAEKEQAERGWD